MMRSPSIDAICEYLLYDAETGLFTWKARGIHRFADERSCKSWNTKHSGKPALTTRNSAGYLYGRIEGVRLAAHRVAIAMASGKWPDEEVDHINGIVSDNRLVNLRCVSPVENGQNCKRRSDNTSGQVGVFKSDSVYRAEICYAGTRRHLGRFKTLEDAISARKAAESELGFHENHGR